ncbi:MAG: Gfo/Idh/MocA family protein [Pyrinomonadaceae bacterium]
MSETNGLNRREFVKTAGTAAATLVLGGTAHAASPLARRRYAIVGTGERSSGMWGRDLAQKYSDVLEFVGLCDINPKRAQAARELIGVDCPTYSNFDEMMDRSKPDLLMVTTVDGFHRDYIVRGLERGVDVMTEKPMTTDEVKCQDILDAEKKAQKKIVVTFNYRYAPKHQKIKEILLSGVLGRIISVDFSWYLDTSHGADYFRRWHRLKRGGGSLWVHKATHHFDLVNWWLGADPVEVAAQGSLEVYGSKGPFRHTNCRPCPHKSECRFYYDMTKDAKRMKLYASAEDVDGYYRDGCVFREDVDIYDSMAATVKYSNGVHMSYSLNAAMPIEGYRVAFNGELGRLEVRDYERQPWAVAEESEMYIIKSGKTGAVGERVKVELPRAEGGHGGGDDRLRDLIFRKTQVPDYMRLPDSRAGAMSCLTGIAARKSIEQKQPIKIADLVRL